MLWVQNRGKTTKNKFLFDDRRVNAGPGYGHAKMNRVNPSDNHRHEKIKNQVKPNRYVGNLYLYILYIYSLSVGVENKYVRTWYLVLQYSIYRVYTVQPYSTSSMKKEF